MAKDYSVELTAPDGRTVVSKSPVDTNNLMYGQGYSLKETKSSTTKSADKTAPKKAGEENA